MKQAVYSSIHGGHYGLASEAYTHFTSPIRRYPDLVVHRLLRMALRKEKVNRENLEKELSETAEHCSYRERIATEAERDSIKLKQVRLMLDHIGDEYDGKIVGMADAGLFVQILNPYVEGIIVKDSMTDDAYEFNEDRMVFYGRRKRRTFKIGDPLKIKVVRSDIDRRQIEFTLIE
jgi:ribonuclease R